jgi:hypothetical protein
MIIRPLIQLVYVLSSRPEPLYISKVIVRLHPQGPRHFCMTTFTVSLTNVTVLLPQSRDNSCCVSRPLLAPPPLCLQKHADYAHMILRTVPTCDLSLGSLTLLAPEAGDFVELLFLYVVGLFHLHLDVFV